MKDFEIAKSPNNCRKEADSESCFRLEHCATAAAYTVILPGTTRVHTAEYNSAQFLPQKDLSVSNKTDYTGKVGLLSDPPKILV